jgi:hypothetical protein
MKSGSRTGAAGFAFLLALGFPSSGLRAQGALPAAGPQLGGQIIHKCRQDSDTAEAVVCGSRERSPYRVPPSADRFDPYGSTASVSRERHQLYEHGASGIGSCSTVGPGGWTGCDWIKWKDEAEQKDGNAKVGFGARKGSGWDYGRDD